MHRLLERGNSSLWVGEAVALQKLTETLIIPHKTAVVWWHSSKLLPKPCLHAAEINIVNPRTYEPSDSVVLYVVDLDMDSALDTFLAGKVAALIWDCRHWNATVIVRTPVGVYERSKLIVDNVNTIVFEQMPLDVAMTQRKRLCSWYPRDEFQRDYMAKIEQAALSVSIDHTTCIQRGRLEAVPRYRILPSVTAISSSSGWYEWLVQKMTPLLTPLFSASTK